MELGSFVWSILIFFQKNKNKQDISCMYIYIYLYVSNLNNSNVEPPAKLSSFTALRVQQG